MALCSFCNRNPLPAPPPPPWGPLDSDGRTWGPITYNPRTAACSCANCELRLRQEFLVMDGDGNRTVTRTEVALALRNFGEPVALSAADKPGGQRSALVDKVRPLGPPLRPGWPLAESSHQALLREFLFCSALRAMSRL